MKNIQTKFHKCNLLYRHSRKCGSLVTNSAPYMIAVAPIMASGSLSFVKRLNVIVSSSMAAFIGIIGTILRNSLIAFSSSDVIEGYFNNSSFVITLTKHSFSKNSVYKSKAMFFCLRKSIITLVSRRSRKLIVPFFPDFSLVINPVHCVKGVFAKAALQFSEFCLQFIRIGTVSGPNLTSIFKVCSCRNRGISEYGFPNRYFLWHFNKKPTGRRYFNSLFYNHKENIRHFVSFVERKDYMGASAPGGIA